MSYRTDLKEWLSRASRLSLIKVDVRSEERILEDFIKIIEFFNQLREVNVENVEPLFINPAGDHVVREDKPRKCLDVSEVLLNTKERVDGYIKGPKTL